jgi:hypothetical protein
MDAKKKNKIPIGGNGVSLFYGEDPAPVLDPIEEDIYTLDLSTIIDGDKCKVNDLILNSDGSFYKIDSIDTDNSEITCTRLAVSGSGGGSEGGTTTRRGKVYMKNLGESNLLNGSSASIEITVNSCTIDGEAVEDNIPIEITFATKDAISGLYTKVY